MAIGEAEYFEQRLDDQIEWYDRKSSVNQAAYKRLRLIEIPTDGLSTGAYLLTVEQGGATLTRTLNVLH